MGVGFVAGAVMAAIIADTEDNGGKPSKFVIGCLRDPGTRSYWKIPLLNRGESPIKAEDPEVDELIKRCVREKKTLVATLSATASSWLTVWLSTCSATTPKTALAICAPGETDMAALEATMRTIGEKIHPTAWFL